VAITEAPRQSLRAAGRFAGERAPIGKVCRLVYKVVDEIRSARRQDSSISYGKSIPGETSRPSENVAEIIRRPLHSVRGNEHERIRRPGACVARTGNDEVAICISHLPVFHWEYETWEWWRWVCQCVSKDGIRPVNSVGRKQHVRVRTNGNKSSAAISHIS